MEEALNKVVVRSVGRATPAVSSALATALSLPHATLARCFYRAPAVLLDRLPKTEALAIRDQLQRTGLVVDVADSDDDIREGGADFDLAVHVPDPSRFREVATEVSRFLGCAPLRAVELLCGSPPVVIGQVSEATADALAERLAPFGAEVDRSRTDEAHYDVFVGDGEAHLRRRIATHLAKAGVDILDEGPVVALGVPRSAATELWTRIGTSAPFRLVDRALQRFDIVLDALPDTDAAAKALTELSGMPAELVPRVRARLPLVVLDGVPMQRAGEALAGLADVGAVASAKLTTTLSFDVVVNQCADVAAAASVLASIANQTAKVGELALQRLPTRLNVAVTLTRGRWLLHELERVGTRASLEER